jgi:hypothetical protein
MVASFMIIYGSHFSPYYMRFPLILKVVGWPGFEPGTNGLKGRLFPIDCAVNKGFHKVS